MWRWKMTEERFEEIKKEAIEGVINRTFSDISEQDRIKVFLWGVNKLFNGKRTGRFFKENRRG